MLFVPVPPDYTVLFQASAQKQATWLKSCCHPLAQINLHTMYRSIGLADVPCNLALGVK